jgi:quercetin dioxygenase-like cupin family protein
VTAVAAEVVLGCPELDPTLDFFTTRLGFQLRTILPADQPTTAVVEGFGLRLRLVAPPSEWAGADPNPPQGLAPARRTGPGLPGEQPPPGRLRLACAEPPLAPGGQLLIAPNGTVIELVSAAPSLRLPEAAPHFELSRFDPARFGTGRAAMRYRDLLPSRQGGRFVASHIVIPDGGPVPDYVHYHRVRFQMIYCWRGWVKLVYEDQGPPFVLEAGDCVLQPPEIRHRVLESSAGLEVVEVGCPAVHDTMTDTDLELPNPKPDGDRLFGTSAPYQPQRFVRHQAREASWEHDPDRVWEQRDTGIAAATGGLAGVRVLRSPSPAARLEPAEGAELCFAFVLEGNALVERRHDPTLELGPGDAVALPAGGGDAVTGWSREAQILEVTLPAAG